MKLVLAVLLLPHPVVKLLHLLAEKHQQLLVVKHLLPHQPLKPLQLLRPQNKRQHQLSSQRLQHNPHNNLPAIRAKNMMKRLIRTKIKNHCLPGHFHFALSTFELPKFV